MNQSAPLNFSSEEVYKSGTVKRKIKQRVNLSDNKPNQLLRRELSTKKRNFKKAVDLTEDTRKLKRRFPKSNSNTNRDCKDSTCNQQYSFRKQVGRSNSARINSTHNQKRTEKMKNNTKQRKRSVNQQYDSKTCLNKANLNVSGGSALKQLRGSRVFSSSKHINSTSNTPFTQRHFLRQNSSNPARTNATPNRSHISQEQKKYLTQIVLSNQKFNKQHCSKIRDANSFDTIHSTKHHQQDKINVRKNTLDNGVDSVPKQVSRLGTLKVNKNQSISSKSKRCKSETSKRNTNQGISVDFVPNQNQGVGLSKTSINQISGDSDRQCGSEAKIQILNQDVSFNSMSNIYRSGTNLNQDVGLDSTDNKQHETLKSDKTLHETGYYTEIKEQISGTVTNLHDSQTPENNANSVPCIDSTPIKQPSTNVLNFLPWNFSDQYMPNQQYGSETQNCAESNLERSLNQNHSVDFISNDEIRSPTLDDSGNLSISGDVMHNEHVSDSYASSLILSKKETEYVPIGDLFERRDFSISIINEHNESGTPETQAVFNDSIKSELSKSEGDNDDPYIMNERQQFDGNNFDQLIPFHSEINEQHQFGMLKRNSNNLCYDSMDGSVPSNIDQCSCDLDIMKKNEITPNNSSHYQQHRSRILENNLNQDVYVDSFDKSKTPRSCADQFTRTMTIQNHQSETFKRHLNENQIDSIDHVIDQEPEFKTDLDHWTRHIYIKSTPSPKCYNRKVSQASPDNISVDYMSKKKCCLGSPTRYVNQDEDYTPQKQYQSKTDISDGNEDVMSIFDTPVLEYSPINSDEDEDHYVDNTLRQEYSPISSDEDEEVYFDETPSQEYSPISSEDEIDADDTPYHQPRSDNHTYEYNRRGSRYHTWELQKREETPYHTEEHNRRGSEWFISDQDKSHESRFGFSSSNDNKQHRSRSRISEHDESAPDRRPRSRSGFRDYRYVRRISRSDFSDLHSQQN
ncbi:hypothetical protein TNIN_81921 [Trichonephila inaurata madagascariensis]|uniref:Uncharacterized protein n=1 Tax=Trichonephila inaurata madagascariensis TaxID=2747483 RepID=A0A8X7CFC6_9ARAC|nr:hypothetical protein TNIN_81921 [Trichonephila inaurata madagascariensis]